MSLNFYCWVPDDIEVFVKVAVKLCDGKSVSKFNFTNCKTIQTDNPRKLKSNIADLSYLNKNGKKPNDNNYIEWDIKEVLKYHSTHESCISNIASITDLNDAALLSIIKSRFKKDLIYTQINTIIICLNPYKSIPNLYNTEIYSKLSKSEQEAHLFYTCYRAKDLLTHSNQSIVVTGESGAGKTETCRQILNFFLNDIHGNIDIKIQKCINACPPIIESLGNAWTIANLNSSRFGKFSRIMIENKCVVGMEIQYYLLERNRIISQTSGERNYHVFYQMIQGLEIDQANRLGLNENISYRYFSNGFIKTKNDKFYFKVFKDGLENIFSKEVTINIIEILATILNLGDLNFIENVEGSYGLNIEENLPFDIITKTLGTDHLPENIRHLLTSKRFRSGSRSSSTMIKYTKDKAILIADSLAKDLYEKLFAYIIKKCNEINLSSEHVNFIGILDIFGFEIYDLNSFEQLCINYCNEKMQQLFNDIIFEEEKTQFLLEGVPSNLITYKGNEDIIELIDGIFSLVDVQCSLGRFHNGEDDGGAIYNQIQANFEGKNAHLKVNKTIAVDGSRQFTILHFAGPALYSISQFVNKNIDKIDDDLNNLLSASSNSILASMYQKVEVDLHELRKQRQKSLVDGIQSRKKSQLKTVASKFRFNLDDLIVNLKRNSLHFIRCINTNNLKLDNNFDSKLVYNQMMHSGIFEIVNIRNQNFSIKMSFIEIHDYLLTHNLYRASGINIFLTDGICNVKVEKINMNAFVEESILVFFNKNLEKTLWFKGKTALYMKNTAWQMILSLENEKYATLIQSQVRIHLAKQYCKKMKLALILIKNYLRCKIIKSRYQFKLNIITYIQCLIRRHLSKKLFGKIKLSRLVYIFARRWYIKTRIYLRKQVYIIIKFIKNATFYCGMKNLILLHSYHRKINNWFLSRIYRIRFIKKCRMIYRIQFWYRRMRNKKLLIYSLQVIRIKMNITLATKLLQRWWRGSYCRQLTYTLLLLNKSAKIIQKTVRKKLERKNIIKEYLAYKRFKLASSIQRCYRKYIKGKYWKNVIEMKRLAFIKEIFFRKQKSTFFKLFSIYRDWKLKKIIQMLFSAVRWGDIEEIELIINSSCKFLNLKKSSFYNICDYTTGFMSMIHIAVTSSNFLLIKFLIDNGSKIYSRNCYGQNPMHLIILDDLCKQDNVVEIVDYLLKQQEDILFKKDFNDLSSLDIIRNTLSTDVKIIQDKSIVKGNIKICLTLAPIIGEFIKKYQINEKIKANNVLKQKYTTKLNLLKEETKLQEFHLYPIVVSNNKIDDNGERANDNFKKNFDEISNYSDLKKLKASTRSFYEKRLSTIISRNDSIFIPSDIHSLNTLSSFNEDEDNSEEDKIQENKVVEEIKVDKNKKKSILVNSRNMSKEMIAELEEKYKPKDIEFVSDPELRRLERQNKIKEKRNEFYINLKPPTIKSNSTINHPKLPKPVIKSKESSTKTTSSKEFPIEEKIIKKINVIDKPVIKDPDFMKKPMKFSMDPMEKYLSQILYGSFSK